MHPLLTFNIITARALELFDPTLPLSPEYVEPMTDTDRLAEMAAEIERLRSRVAELEAIVTVGHGTMGTLQPGTGPSGDEPATITHGHAPSAPPYDE